MSESPKFGILTSTFNRANCMKEWANSIIVQDYRPLEVVLINDMSTDDSDREASKVSREFEKKGIDFIYVKNKEKLYCASSYKKAMSNSTADYFGIVDSDDMIVPGAVEFIVGKYLANPDLGFIYTQFDWCNREGRRARRGFSRAPRRKTSMLDSELSSYSRHCYSHWRTCKRMPKIETIWRDGLKVSVDKRMGYRLEELAKGAFVNKVCYRYREGMNHCVTKNEKPIQTWHFVRKEAAKRRKKYGIKPFPVIEIDP